MPLLAGCVGVDLLTPPPWSDYYEPRYPDHRFALELCRASSADDQELARCMEDAIVPYADRGTILARPEIVRR